MVHYMKLIKYHIKIYAKILHKANVKLHVQHLKHNYQLAPNIFLFQDLQEIHYCLNPYILNNTNKTLTIEA